MGTITTKYSIGDTVYFAGMTTERKQHPCPDCKGLRKWKAASPAGGEYEFDCPRCSAGYQAHGDLSLAYTAYAPRIQSLTVGSYEIASHREDRPISYMCRETGVGSGAVYSEADLFPTEDEAMRASETKCAVANSTTLWITDRYSKSLSVSDYQLSDACLKEARQSRARWEARLQSLFSDLDNCQSIEELKNTLEEFREKRAA